MKQGNKTGILATLLKSFGYEGADHLLGNKGMSIPTRGRNKGRRIRARNQGKLYKSATSGFPRTSQPCGSIPAPTLDQVRAIEIKYGQRLHVKHGIMFFKEDGEMFTAAEALVRQHDDEHQECINLPTIAELEALGEANGAV